jgi:glycosyltransferase involved in cell wall biosynthesis
MASEAGKIRILHVVTGLSTGGAEMMLFKLLSATRNSCSQAVLSLKDEGTMGPRIKELDIPVHALGLTSRTPNPFRAFSIRSLVRRFQPEIIMGWMVHGNLMATFASSVSAGKIPVIWGVHQSVREVGDFGRLTGIAIRLGALLSRSPAKIIYVSQTGAKQHEALGYCAARRIVMPNGIDCESFHPDLGARRQVCAELGIAPESVLVGLVARYHPMKDHAGFLSAAAQLARTHPSVRFMLVGNGVTSDQLPLQEMIHQQGLEDRVFLLGERRDTARLTAALDIACSASAWGEAFSIVIGEAMACAVPCVVTDVGDNAFLVGETGLSVPAGRPEALADAIGRLIDAGADYRQQLGLAARQRIESEFSLPAIAHRYETLYREVIAERTAIPALRARTVAPDAVAQSRKRIPDSWHAPPTRVESPAAGLRVLHIINDLNIGGTEMMLFKLLSAVRERDCHAVVSLKDQSTMGPRIKELGVPVYALGLSAAAPSLFRAFSIRSLVRQFRPHVIQGWLYHGNLMASLGGAFSQNGVAVLWNIRQSLENIAGHGRKTAAVIKLGAWMSNRPAAIIYNSRTGARDHERFGFRNARQILIHNGFDCGVFCPDEDVRNRVRHQLGVEKETVLVGLVARYDPIKDHRGFLRAAGIIAQSHRNVRFALLGKGVTEKEPRLMQAIAEERLHERVLLLGERLDVERITCALDIACSASSSEGFSNAIGEAMSCGVPCVVTDVGDSAFLVGDTGMAVQMGGPENLAEAMATAIATLADAGSERRRQLGMAARQRVESEFSLPVIAGRYEEVYREFAPRIRARDIEWQTQI